MGAISSVKKFFNISVGSSGSRFDDELINSILRGLSSAAGVTVTPVSALGVSTVYACVNRIASTVATVPLKLYKRIPSGGKEPAHYHRLYQILHDAPNPEMTSVDFRRTVQGQLSLRSNGYSIIERNGMGEVSALWPVNPSSVILKRDGDGVLQYTVDEKNYGPDKIIHLRNFSSNGIQGMDTMSIARESIALAMALTENAARFFGNGSRPGAILQTDSPMTAEQVQRLKTEWGKNHEGVEKSHSVEVLYGGLKYLAQRMANDEAQFMESRKHQAIEICQVFGIPPHKVGILDKATFSNIEEQNIEYVVDTILPQLRVWEQTLNHKLLSERERGEYFFEFNVEGLLRGDISKRYAAYAVGRQWGWLNADEIREKENQNPLPEGKGQVYLEPMNMRPAGTANTESE